MTNTKHLHLLSSSLHGYRSKALVLGAESKELIHVTSPIFSLWALHEANGRGFQQTLDWPWGRKRQRLAMNLYEPLVGNHYLPCTPLQGSKTLASAPSGIISTGLMSLH